jgi:hypothetical protein
MIRVEEIWAPNNEEMEKALNAIECVHYDEVDVFKVDITSPEGYVRQGKIKKGKEYQIVQVVHLHDDFYRVIYRV